VSDAHRLTLAAANAFLKTLEEPPPSALIILVTANPAALLPTIQSRCQRQLFEPYGEEELASVLGTVTDVDPESALRFARQADGNARRAVALTFPEARTLDRWARELVGSIHTGARGSVHLAAGQLHAGTLPEEILAAVDGDADQKAFATADFGAKRDRALQLCEMLNLYYSEMLAFRERGDAWSPRLLDTGEVTTTAARRRSPTLIADLMRVERAKGDIERNINIGLCMAVLFEDLIDHAETDQQAAGP
jgi:DNA polymerase III delta prime subunit